MIGDVKLDHRQIELNLKQKYESIYLLLEQSNKLLRDTIMNNNNNENNDKEETIIDLKIIPKIEPFSR